MYAHYCSNQATSMEILNSLKNKKGKDVSSFLQYCLLLPECGGLTIESYLIKPIQVKNKTIDCSPNLTFLAK